MTILLIVGGLFTLLTLFFFGRTVRCTRQRRLLRAGGSVFSSAVSAVIATAAVTLTFSYLSYSRLTAEQIVSSIEFRRVSGEEYQARLMIPGEKDRFLNLRGDEWQMDARLVNWTPPATILGLDPIYRLERLSGRYSEIDREINEARTVHALSPSQPMDVWQVAQRFPILLPGVDAYYGTATYLPMVDGARFEVSLSRDALIARPANDIAREAVGRWDQR